MKKVILPDTLEDTVYWGEVNEENIYAAYAEEYGHTMLVVKIRNASPEEQFRVVWPYSGEMIDMFDGARTLSDMVKNMMEAGYQVYEFDDEYEYAKWILSIFDNVLE